MDDVNIIFYYLCVLVKFVYFFGDMENCFCLKFIVGFFLGFLIGNDFKMNGVNIELVDDDVCFNINYKIFDFGGQVLFGFNYCLVEVFWFNVDVYYYQGFLDINNCSEYNFNFGLCIGVVVGF